MGPPTVAAIDGIAAFGGWGRCGTGAVVGGGGNDGGAGMPCVASCSDDAAASRGREQADGTMRRRPRQGEQTPRAKVASREYRRTARLKRVTETINTKNTRTRSSSFRSPPSIASRLSRLLARPPCSPRVGVAPTAPRPVATTLPRRRRVRPRRATGSLRPLARAPRTPARAHASAAAWSVARSSSGGVARSRWSAARPGSSVSWRYSLVGSFADE